MSPPKSDTQILLCENYESVCETAAQTLLTLSEKTIAERKRFVLSLSGGATPKGMYRLMSSGEYENAFRWQAMHFFWGDERYVPPDNHKSNYRMVAESLLTKVDVPMENIHPVKTREKNPAITAELYEQEIRHFFNLKSGDLPRFDTVLLGLGQDGHVASLFPGDIALEETKKLVVPVAPEQTVEERITLTLPVINEARNVIFLVTGSEKSHALHAVLEDSPDCDKLPASKVSPRRGSLIWIVDKSAASLLTIKRISSWR